MKAYGVRVRTLSTAVFFYAIGRDAGAIASAALDLFDLCSVSVTPLSKERACQ